MEIDKSNNRVYIEEDNINLIYQIAHLDNIDVQKVNYNPDKICMILNSNRVKKIMKNETINFLNEKYFNNLKNINNFIFKDFFLTTYLYNREEPKKLLIIAKGEFKNEN